MSLSLDIDLSVGVDATCNKSLGSCGLPDEFVDVSQSVTSVPMVAIFAGPVTPILSIPFEFVIGGDFSSVIGDLCRALFGVVGEVVFPEGNNPLPAVTEPPVDALMDRGAVDDRVILFVLLAPYICDVNGFIDGAPFGEVAITCAANRGNGRDMGSVLAFK